MNDLEITKKIKFINIDIIKKIIITFIIVMSLEIFVFNFNSLRTYLGNYETKTFTNIEPYETTSGKVFFKLNNINSKTASIKIELDDEKMKKDEFKGSLDYTISYSDDTSDGFFSLPTKRYIMSYEKSKYMPLYLSGNTKKLKLALDEDLYLGGYIKQVVVNEKIPFDINFTRIFIILAIILVVMFLRNSKDFQSNYEKKSFKQETILLGVIYIFMLILIIINGYSTEEADGETSNWLLKSLTTEGGVYNKDFVDALESKSLYLLDDPSEEFKELENPYDVKSRSNLQRNVDYKWDTAYYNGHQYIYFGILPILVFFLPFHLITGAYLKISVVVLLLSFFIFILLKEILLKLINRYYKDIPFKVVFMALIILCSSSLVLYANGMSRVYELVIISGLYCSLQGIFFIMKSSESDKRKFLNIALGSIFLALSVACRPTFLLVSLIVLPYFIKLLLQYYKENKKNLIKLLVGIIIPYSVVGILLMWYNYARFDNPFEFGANYQLTLNNMKELKSRIFSIPVGLACNLFNLPSLTATFPFVENNNNLITFYGYYYIENMIAGLFILSPICFLSLYWFKIMKKEENKELKFLISTLLIVSLLIASVSVMLGGSNERYIMDYAWMVVFACILIFFGLYKRLESNESKKIIYKILKYIAIYTFIFSIITGIVSEKNFLKTNSPEIYYLIKYIICFWE